MPFSGAVHDGDHCRLGKIDAFPKDTAPWGPPTVFTAPERLAALGPGLWHVGPTLKTLQYGEARRAEVVKAEVVEVDVAMEDTSPSSGSKVYTEEDVNKAHNAGYASAHNEANAAAMALGGFGFPQGFSGGAQGYQQHDLGGGYFVPDPAQEQWGNLSHNGGYRGGY